jgi:hypothetical protein
MIKIHIPQLVVCQFLYLKNFYMCVHISDKEILFANLHSVLTETKGNMMLEGELKKLQSIYKSASRGTEKTLEVYMHFRSLLKIFYTHELWCIQEEDIVHRDLVKQQNFEKKLVIWD